MPRRLARAGVFSALIFLAPPYAAPARPALARLPRVILWAWERPEDLRSAGRDVGVAFLAQTITRDGDRVRVRPRFQPLRVGRDTVLVAVTRVEDARSARLAPPIDSDQIAAAIARTSRLPQVAAVQVDFDAALSERPFYRRLLEQLRARMDPSVALSMTALASWCAGDDWLQGLPIDEAVPMLFRMGPLNEPFLRLAQSRTGARAECRGAVGVSTDEPRAIDAARRRVYIFSPTPWTARTIADARRVARP